MPRTTHLRSSFFILLLVFSFGGTLSLAAPTSSCSSIKQLAKDVAGICLRHCPSSTVFAEEMQKKYHVGSSTVFYSHPVTSDAAQKFIDKSGINPKGHSWFEMDSDKQLLRWSRACEEHRFSDRISKAIALASNAGTHYLLVNKTSPPREDSHWMLHEYPTLQRKPGVVIEQIFVDDINWDNLRGTWKAKAHQIWPSSEAKMLPPSKADD